MAIPLDPKTVANFSLNDLPRVDKLAMEYENTNKDEQKENNEHKGLHNNKINLIFSSLPTILIGKTH